MLLSPPVASEQINGLCYIELNNLLLNNKYLMFSFYNNIKRAYVYTFYFSNSFIPLCPVKILIYHEKKKLKEITRNRELQKCNLAVNTFTELILS